MAKNNEELCSPKAQPTTPGGHPAPTGSSATSDENLKELLKALNNAASKTRQHLPVPTPEDFKKIVGKISKDIAEVEKKCIDSQGNFEKRYQMVQGYLRGDWWRY
ncbi:unnamed protein product [Nippostrongylus brasiliensis]|uniref:SynN domain-containing protein n=1 Tax=Nippostrongylus brasiliensis TaxID=27835 RepID=A0A0N4Y0R7_NIPBR|nr:unnamed protein product [Nippostrongylus brasiliensis]